MIRVRPAALEDLPAMTHVLADAFGVKMRVLYGRDPERIRRILTTMYRGPLSREYDGLLIAELDRQVVGVLVIEPMPWDGSDADRLVRVLATELSAWRQMFTRIGFSVFSHGPNVGDAYLSDVGVLSSARGKGVGKALVQHAEGWAIAHQRTALALWVASNNPVARRLYERAGMVALHHEINLLSGVLYGVPRWTYMRKVLTT